LIEFHASHPWARNNRPKSAPMKLQPNSIGVFRSLRGSSWQMRTTSPSA
jgi:hypothetical protein